MDRYEHQPLVDGLSWLRELQKAVLEMQHQWGLRLSTWLVLGNATALVLTINGALTHAECDVGSVASIASKFAWGLICAFGGAALGYLLSMRAVSLINEQIGSFTTILTNEHYIDFLKKDGVDEQFHGDLQPKIDQALAAQPTIERKMALAQRLAVIPLVVLVVSAVLFVWALMSPLSDGGAFLRMCASTPV